MSIRDLTATEAQLKELLTIIPVAVQLNAFQQNTLAASLDETIGLDLTVRQWFERVNAVDKPEQEKLEILKDTVFRLRARLMQGELDRIIKERGWAIQGVFSNEEGQPSFAYTVGLCHSLNLELLQIGPVDVNTMSAILNDYAAALTSKDCTIEQLLEPTDRFIKGANGATYYSKLIRVSANEAREKYVRNTRGDNFAVYQVLVQDVDNYFPGDKDYDVEFDQGNLKRH